ADLLVERFGERVIGLQISRHGDGAAFEWRPVKKGKILVYTVGRTFLFDLLHREMQRDKVRIAGGAPSARAYEQLMQLEMEKRETGVVYKCLPGRHDDLAISCAMLGWAAQHQHLERWCWPLQPVVRIRRPAPSHLGYT